MIYIPFLGPAVPPVIDAALLLHFEGADGDTNIIDSSPYARVLTGHAACRISTTRSKWGTSSLKITRTLNSIGAPTDLSTDFARAANEPWSFDFWVYYEQSVFDESGFLFYFDDNTANQDFLQFYRGSPNYHLFYGNNTPGTEESPTATVFTRNQWVHVALGYDGTTVRRFHDGTQVFSRARTTVSATHGRVTVGGVYSQPGTTDDGVTVVYMDEFRFVLGSCEYTANFTPPTGPY